MTDVPSDAFDIRAAVVVRESESGKALFVEAPEFGDKQLCIPKSVVHDDSEVYDVGHEGTMLIARWFAEIKKWL